MPGDHACPQCFDASSVQSCPTCSQLVLSTGGIDPKLTLQEHLDSQCTRHLLPPVASTTIPCNKAGCKRQDRVVAHCLDCEHTYCLGHRHPADHDCVGLARKKDQQAQRKAEIRQVMAKHAGKFPQREEGGEAATATATATVGSSQGDGSSLHEKKDKKETKAKPKLSAREIIEAAKAKVAQRSSTTAAAAAAPIANANASTTARTSAIVASSAAAAKATTTAEKPKVKRPSRAMALIQLRKVAQGDPKVTGAQRIYLHTRSPTVQGVTGKSVFLDRTWTVGKALDRMIDILKVVPAKPDPNNPDKHLSIFHAKEEDSEPVLIPMSTTIKDISGIESGDLFYIAFSDWDKTLP
ncbi:hypothetical protein DFQ26_001066 [Actinomortierella ambigua]|nr:hypothetical protein DFQ26_001066 [Actinomortierella ambigua]